MFNLVFAGYTPARFSGTSGSAAMSQNEDTENEGRFLLTAMTAVGWRNQNGIDLEALRDTLGHWTRQYHRTTAVRQEFGYQRYTQPQLDAALDVVKTMLDDGHQPKNRDEFLNYPLARA